MVSASGAGFVLVAAGTGLVSSLALIPPALPLLWLSPAAFHKVTNSVAGCWFRLLVWLIECQNGVQFVFTGDRLADERCVLVSNHRTRLDWMLLWSLFARAGTLEKLRIVLKAGLKSAPGFGFVMQSLGFLFLQRDFSQDEAHMRGMLGCYREAGVQLLIFPEGTDLSESNLQKSKAFAEKNGLPVYQQVLHPRTKGYCVCQEELAGGLDAVYDVTIGYPDSVPQSESTILEASWPAQVHVNVRRIPADQLPEGDKVAPWIEQLFRDKEAALAKFAKDKKFPAPKVDYPELEGTLRVTVLLWTVVCGGFGYIFARSSLFRWACLAMFVMHFVITKLGGLDKFEVAINQQRMQVSHPKCN